MAANVIFMVGARRENMFAVRVRRICCVLPKKKKGRTTIMAEGTTKRSTTEFKEEKEKERDVRASNIVAAKGELLLHA
jgi:hypothetical protein